MNLLEFGDVTSALKPKNRSSRVLHFGTSSRLTNNDALEETEERPESESGDDERGDDVWSSRGPNSLYSLFRFTQVPPKSKVTTTSGSATAPIPMTMFESYSILCLGGFGALRCKGLFLEATTVICHGQEGDQQG